MSIMDGRDFYYSATRIGNLNEIRMLDVRTGVRVSAIGYASYRLSRDLYARMEKALLDRAERDARMEYGPYA
jgi:hypothetical protein